MVTLSGAAKAVIAELANASSGILLIAVPLSNVTVLIPLPRNTALPSVVTDAGITTVPESFAVFSNADCSITLSLEFSATMMLSIGVSANAILPMNSTDAGILTLLIPE